MNFSDPNDAWTLFHELQHVVQYANRGGVEPFLAEYALKAGGSVLRGGSSIDMHDNIDLERDANAKADQVSAAVSKYSQQGNGGITPAVVQSPAMGNVCRTPVLVCLLPTFGPVGVGCYCGTVYGPSGGVVTQN